eukprot:3249992-Pyramimonas_sp.AAC.1
MLPKGDEPAGIAECYRAPEQLRPLAVTSADVEIVASAANRKLHPLVQQVFEIQLEFVPGRQFHNNVVEVDAYSRFCSMGDNTDANLPCCLSIDIAA